LRDAGLGSLPGGGAEIFDDRVHDEAFKGKVREDKWFEVHRVAHSLGLYTNATMLYGHVERIEERVRHLVKLRELQGESLKGLRDHVTAGLRADNTSSVLSPSVPQSLSPSRAFFNCVIPLSFIPEHSELGHLPGPTGLTDLRTLAIARLMLDNFAHVKAFWIMQSLHLSQLALDWGCDDLDGTVVWYDITKREGRRGTTHQEVHVNDLKRLIREAGKTPVERDTLYREVKRDPDTDRVENINSSRATHAAV
jgi:aminodeoxyfutalosine synthase